MHYKDTLNTIVDVNIKLKNPLTTIQKATIAAKDLRDILEESANIHKANIYLDLNESMIIPATTPTSAI